MSGQTARLPAEALTPEQVAARRRWQRRWNIPILLAASVPLFVNSPDSRVVAVAVGVGSWLVFVVDLWVQRRLVPSYLRTRSGLIDLGVVVRSPTTSSWGSGAQRRS
jgi:hypothetical protein